MWAAFLAPSHPRNLKPQVCHSIVLYSTRMARGAISLSINTKAIRVITGIQVGPTGMFLLAQYLVK